MIKKAGDIMPGDVKIVDIQNPLYFSFEFAQSIEDKCGDVEIYFQGILTWGIGSNKSEHLMTYNPEQSITILDKDDQIHTLLEYNQFLKKCEFLAVVQSPMLEYSTLLYFDECGNLNTPVRNGDVVISVVDNKLNEYNFVESVIVSPFSSNSEQHILYITGQKAIIENKYCQYLENGGSIYNNACYTSYALSNNNSDINKNRLYKLNPDVIDKESLKDEIEAINWKFYKSIEPLAKKYSNEESIL